jgi:hypothetical protein
MFYDESCSSRHCHDNLLGWIVDLRSFSQDALLAYIDVFGPPPSQGGSAFHARRNG